jgi:gliding motility-associated-like protein
MFVKYLLVFFFGACVACSNAQSNEFYEFPSAFSPNGDVRNDSLGLVVGSKATLESMAIFNRWGVVLFDNVRDGKSHWDGRYLGTEQPAGTYLLRARVKLPNGEVKSETRMISLIR